MSKHTPGPWKARMQYSRNGRELGWMVEHSNGRIGWASLAYADTNEEAPAEDPANAANARLIAAAPDLVEALRKAVKLNSFREFNDHIPAMKAALAKVEASNG